MVDTMISETKKKKARAELAQLIKEELDIDEKKYEENRNKYGGSVKTRIDKSIIKKPKEKK